MPPKRRVSQASNSCWAELPLLVVDSVMHKVDLKDLLRMRLVCKAWKAACSTFSGEAEADIEAQSDLDNLCAALPGLTGLYVTSCAVDFSLQPLSACSNLRFVNLRNESPPNQEELVPKLDLDRLPANLEHMTLGNFDYTGGPFEPARFLHLTSLTLCWRPNAVSEVWGLLESLPKLEDVHLTEGGTIEDDSHEFEDDVRQAFRISSLTSLIISRASLRGEVSAVDIQGLRELYLWNVSLNEAWIQKIATSLPGLTHLSLGTCSVEVAGFWAEVMPANTLRSLTVRECQTFLVRLAGPGLEMLHYEAQSESHPGFAVLDMARVAALGALTSLKLTDYCLKLNLQLLQALGLVELVMNNCLGAEQQLFVLGALTRLQRLHIEEDCTLLPKTEAGLAAHNPECMLKARKLRSIGKTVLGLSKLSRISGGCELFMIGMKEGLQAWQHSVPDEKANWPGTGCPHHQHIWTRNT